MSTRVESGRMVAHYFRTEPRLSFRVFAVNALLRVTVCRARGHKRGDFAFRLLGLCDRCLEPC